ncbi:recombinase family protein [Algisphaera agarilytica]|uniref:DNA invertase Pin-like site-specific DNA recombinase n=1 Tax=Algisphaera agarilytica TaxID=1385975 RepID=A0A7X0H4C8_9BACT|nr:recombinase family protein [Algisphaera agarilytica]MBB6428848.1 DNA invertase Pin-like site-specific DNA recombinase [Algisphaera agarilytica]
MVSQPAPRFVAYHRVSTARQGRSGLGLEAQEEAVRVHTATVGGTILEAFTEVESGKRRDRPELAKALAAAKRRKAVLIVAKLDRLARNVAFLSALMESGVDFVACDNPHASRLTIHILAAVAEDEARRISERTKAALAARKARGLPLGNPANLTPGNSPAPQMNKTKAQADAERMRPVVESILGDTSVAVESVRGLCRELKERGYVTASGSDWHPTSTSRLLVRLGLEMPSTRNY